MLNTRKVLLKYAIVFACFGLIVFYSCDQKPKKISRSFCYWKTSLDLSDKEDSMMNVLAVDHLYIRYFDVDWNPYQKEALPVGTINTWFSANLRNKTITPCVFITNAVMENATAEQLNELASKIKIRVESILSEQSERYSNEARGKYESNIDQNKTPLNNDSIKKIIDSIELISKNEFKNKVEDILIDCDWTEKTKANYFIFLKKIKEQFSTYSISATVRLWQYKDRETSGIPPVDRCLLMCYNLNSPAQYNIKNSICSIDELKRYITDGSYPLSVDVALPIFNSGVIFRNGTFKGLISNVHISDYKNDTLNYKQIKENVFMFKTDQVIGNTLIRYGDELRIEQLTANELNDISDFLSSKLALNENSRVTLFSWDTSYINNYGIENIKKQYHFFEH